MKAVKVEAVARFGNYKHDVKEDIEGSEMECPNCGEDAWWQLAYDYSDYKRQLGALCIHCRKVFIPLVPKARLEPESLILMDLQERVRKLEE